MVFCAASELFSFSEVSEKEIGLTAVSQPRLVQAQDSKLRPKSSFKTGSFELCSVGRKTTRTLAQKNNIPEKQNEHFVILKSATRHRSSGPKFFSQPRPLNWSRNIGLAPKFSGNYSAAASPRPKNLFFFSVEPAPKIFRVPGPFSANLSFKCRKWVEVEPGRPGLLQGRYRHRYKYRYHLQCWYR